MPSLRRALALLTALSLLAALSAQAEPYFWLGFAGNTYPVNSFRRPIRGLGSEAIMSAPSGVATDAASGNVFVALQQESAILKITPDGIVSTYAGSTFGMEGTTDGPRASALFKKPSGVAVDGSGNVYVADTGNNSIRKIAANGTVSTVKTGISFPKYIASDAAGKLFVATADTLLYMMDGAVSNPPVTTLSDALLTYPAGLAVDTSNGDLYIADPANHTIVKRTSAGVFSIVAGTSGTAGFVDATGTAAQFNYPVGVAVDPATHTLFVADRFNYAIRKITSGGGVTTIGGALANTATADGAGANAGFVSQQGIARGSNGQIYVADAGTFPAYAHRIVRGVDVAGAIALTSPASASVNGASLTVSYTLPAAAQAGSVKLLLDSGAGAAYRLAVNDTERTAGAHSFSVSAKTPVSGKITGADYPAFFYDGILTRNSYIVTLEYKDAGSGLPVFTIPSFGVSIDHTPPAFAQESINNALSVEATSANGAVVTFSEGITDSLSDVATSSIKLGNTTVHSGDTFPLGQSQVDFTATDNVGNTGTFTLYIYVSDTTSPTANAPAVITVEANSTGHATVGDLTGQLTNVVEAVTVPPHITQGPNQYQVLPIGTYPLTFTLTDDAGNPATTLASMLKIAYPTLTTPAVSASVVAGAVVKGTALGAAVPGAGANVIPAAATFGTFFTPALSDLRDLAARVILLNGTKKLGAIYREDGAGVGSIVAIEGGQAPGFATGVKFKSLLDPLLAPDGTITFGGKVADKSLKAGEDEALWSNVFSPFSNLANPTAITRVLHEGDPVGLGAGVLLKSITSVSPRFDEIIAFVKLTGSAVTAKNDTAILQLTYDGGTAAILTTSLLRTGDKVDGKTILGISAFQPGVASTGQGRTHADDGIVVRAKTDIGGDEVIAVEKVGTPHTRLSTVGPTTLVNAPVTKIFLPTTAGTATSVRATVKFPAPGKTVDALFLASVAGDFTQVLKVGDPISAAGGAPTFTAFTDPAVGDSPWASFRGTFTGKAPATTGIFQWTGSTPRQVALGGDAAPDKVGTAIPDTAFKTFLNYAQPDGPTARPVFVAEVTGKAVTATNKLGLWAETGTKSLSLLLRNGQDVSVPNPVAGPPLTKKLASFRLLDSLPGSFGSRRSYNAQSSVAVLATFTDKSQALLRPDIP